LWGYWQRQKAHKGTLILWTYAVLGIPPLRRSNLGLDGAGTG